MKCNPHHSHHDLKRRLGLLSGPLALSFALVAGACSSNDVATTTEAPTAIIGDTPTTTDDIVAVEVTAPSATSEAVLWPDENPPNPELGSNHADGDAVDEFLAELDVLGFSGTVIAQSPDGVWSAGFGSADRSGAVDNEIDTVYDIGSLTKQFTAAAILRLEMDGRLSVDDAIGQHLDGLTPAQSEITLHQLLTHTSGVPNAIGLDDEVVALPDYLARLASTEFPATPIGQYAYSNVGYSLLGAVVEAASGDSYEVYLRNALFEPAGMVHTGYVLPDWSDATIAVGYNGDEVFGRPNERPWDVDGPGWNLRANGGLLSTMPDMLRWDEALRGDEILDANAKEKMYTPHVEVAGGDGAFSGYGWNLVPFDDGTTLIFHSGTNHIFYADFFRFVDRDVTIAIASNVADPLALEVAGGLASALLPDLFDDGVCELDSPSVEAAAGFDVVADYPDTPVGRAMAAWIDVVLDGTPSDLDADAMLTDYVQQSIGEGFLDELGSKTVVELIGSLRADFDGFEVELISQEDDTTFHVVIADTSGNEAVISARLEDAPTPRVDCIGISS
ncbi:MAG: serine hydrolase domain-containing protein [Ilumatobacter sp.]